MEHTEVYFAGCGMSSQQFTVEKDSDLQELTTLIGDCLEAFGSVTVEVTKGERTRTQTQNKCLHQYCEDLAQALNGAGYDMKKTIRQELEIPWSKNSVKEYLWRPTQQAMYDKQSTTEPTTVEYQEIYKVLDKAIAERTGVRVEWPSRFNMKSLNAA